MFVCATNRSLFTVNLGRHSVSLWSRKCKLWIHRHESGVILTKMTTLRKINDKICKGEIMMIVFTRNRVNVSSQTNNESSYDNDEDNNVARAAVLM